MSDDERDNGPSAPEEAAEAPGDSQPQDGDEINEIEALRQENAGLRERLLRAVAEMENLRKRTQREKEDASRFAISSFARDLLTVGDDLRRAIEAAPAEAREQSDNPAANLLSGIELTERQFLQMLERHGVRRFDPQGEKFDPGVHEAMFELPDPSIPAGTVVQVLEAGFMIGERVLRPARVGVAKGGPKTGGAKTGGAKTGGAKTVSAAPSGGPDTDEPAAEPDSKANEPPAGPKSKPDTGPDSEAAEDDAESGAGVGARVDRSA